MTENVSTAGAVKAPSAPAARGGKGATVPEMGTKPSVYYLV